MAPVKPKRKPSTYPSSTSTLPSTKKDKRTIKHSALLSKIQKSSTKPLKRRRPSKKLATTLGSLADALPDVAGASTSRDQASRIRQGRADAASRNKSLKTRPGSMKRKVKVEQAERERMGLNMAQLAKATKGEGGGLEALKRHLQEQMKDGA